MFLCEVSLALGPVVGYEEMEGYGEQVDCLQDLLPNVLGYTRLPLILNPWAQPTTPSDVQNILQNGPIKTGKLVVVFHS